MNTVFFPVQGCLVSVLVALSLSLFPTLLKPYFFQTTCNQNSGKTSNQKVATLFIFFQVPKTLMVLDHPSVIQCYGKRAHGFCALEHICSVIYSPFTYLLLTSSFVLKKKKSKRAYKTKQKIPCFLILLLPLLPPLQSQTLRQKSLCSFLDIITFSVE